MDSNEPRRQIIIGHANSWHDAALAVGDGDQLFAEGIERHTQCKRALDMPQPWYSWRALRSFLSGTGEWPVKNADVMSISTWTTATPEAAFKSLSRPTQNPFVALVHAATLLEPVVTNQLSWTLRGHPPRPFTPPPTSSPGVLPAGNVSWQAKTLVHQLAHAANAVYTSPFEECAVMIMDGYGEGSALSLFSFRDGRFKLVHQVRPGVSLGLLYGLVTQFCGFNPYEGEEWKVMGLAAWGEPREELYGFFKQRIVVDGIDVDFRPVGEAEYAFDAQSWAELERLAGGFRTPADSDVQRSADLAFNFQRCFEETVVELVRNFGRLGISKNLAFAGGCALNSAVSGKLVPQSDFESLHVPCAPADDGNCLGAVLWEKYQVRNESWTPAVLTPYLGSAVEADHLERVLELGGIKHRRASDEAALCEQVAGLIADGKIVGWMQGRAEFGPRALGNRSILADPRSPTMKNQINSRVKFREFYRPLAPSVLEEHGAEYFEDFQASPYMERTLRFRPEVRERVPAVVHKDGTGRLQTVTEAQNPLFYGLIRAFYQKTGVPLLLNTSFNVMGRPIVHSVEDAIAVFFTTGLDYLVIDRYLLEK